MKRDDHSIFVNILNSKWIKFPNDVANILQYVDERNMSDSKMENMLFDNSIWYVLNYDIGIS